MPTPKLKRSASTASRNIDAMLRDKYNDQGWAYLTEVRDAISLGRSHSRADALAFSLWEGRGLELHGHEIKSDRSDLLRELQRPDKAEAVQRFCDRWWLVLADRSLIKEGELPPTWGLMAPAGGVLRVIVKAPKLKPVPWTRQFVCGVIRQVATRYMARSEHSAILERIQREHRESVSKLGGASVGQTDAHDDELAQALRAASWTKRELDNLQARVTAFEAASGLTIQTFYGWNGNRRASAVGRLADHLATNPDSLVGGNRLSTLAEQLRAAVTAIDEAAQALEAPFEAGGYHLYSGMEA